MKSARIIIGILRLAVFFILLSLSPKLKKHSTRCFKFVGNTVSTGSLTNPANWIEDINVYADESPECVKYIDIVNNQEYLIYTSGPNSNRPRVDDASYGLRNDVLTAGGHGSPDIIQQISGVDYQIHVGSCVESY